MFARKESIAKTIDTDSSVRDFKILVRIPLQLLVNSVNDDKQVPL